MRMKSIQEIIALPDRVEVHIHKTGIDGSDEKIISLFKKIPVTGDRDVIMNISKVKEINSSGIRLIINLVRCLRSHDRSLMIAGMGHEMETIFTVTNLIKVVHKVDVQ